MFTVSGKNPRPDLALGRREVSKSLHEKSEIVAVVFHFRRDRCIDGKNCLNV